jgi:DNA-directed RNA polymerase subunit RPC12/RpoP
MNESKLYICQNCGHHFLDIPHLTDYEPRSTCPACYFDVRSGGNYLWQPRHYDVIVIVLENGESANFHLNNYNYKKQLRRLKKLTPLTRKAYKYLRKRFKRKFLLERGY